jgi:hypothetical protein
VIRDTDIIAALKADAAVMAIAKDVLPGSDVPSVEDQLQASPSIFVGDVLTEKAGGNSTATMVTRQPVTAYYAVLLGFNQIGANGNEQNNAVVTLREAVKNALVGWTPNSAIANPMLYGGCQTVVIDPVDDKLFHQVNFSSSYTLRKVNSET